MAERFALSVRVRTTALATVFVSLTLTIGSAVLIMTLDRSLVTSSDGIDRARTHDLARLAARHALPSVLPGIADDGVAQVVDHDGRVIAASPNIRGAEPLSDTSPPVGAEPVVRTLRDAPDDDETEDYRIWVLSAPTPRGPVTIFVGTSLETVPEAVQNLRRSLLVGVPATALLIALLTWALVGRALSPVEAIRARVAAISDPARDGRVPVPKTQDEVGRLAVTMNEMLDRLQAAQRQQREFVADASHELQSPLAAMRAQLEVAVAHPGGTDWTRLSADLLEDCDHNERLVRDLLFLARNDERLDRKMAPEPLDLDDLVLEEVARQRSLTGLRIETSGVSAAPVLGNRDELQRLVRNLLENAVRHAVSEVRLSVRSVDTSVRLDVVDDGPGIPAPERERVFDRFYRTDASRARDTGGTGLGLAIAHAVAVRHDGSLTVIDSPHGAHFVLELPAEGGAPSQTAARGSAWLQRRRGRMGSLNKFDVTESVGE